MSSPTVRTVTCSTATFSGTLTAPADPFTLTPTYSGCDAAPTAITATVVMNGCDYSLAADTTGAALTADLLCPAGKDIEIYIYENAKKHEEAIALCAYTVKEQTGLPLGTYENLGGTVRLTLKASPAMTVTKGLKILCGAAVGSTVSAILEGTVDLSGKTDSGGASDPLEIGVVATASLTASWYPASLSGSQVSTNELVIGGSIRTVTCSTATFSGTLTAPADPFTLTPTYSGCDAAPTAIPATVMMNGCDYSLANTTGAALTADLLCPAGKDIEIHIYENAKKHEDAAALCDYTIKEQTGLPAGTYENVGGGTIRLTLNASPVTTVENPLRRRHRRHR